MEEQPQENKKEGSISKIRTFKDDLAQAVKGGGVSTAKIAIKEQQRRVSLGIERNGDKKSSKKALLVIVSFIFLLLALGIFAILTFDPSLSFLGINNSEESVEIKEEVNLFENTQGVEINRIAGRTTVFEKFDQIYSSRQPDQLKTFEFYTKDPSGQLVPATSSEFFTYIQANPDRLDRSIDNIIYGLDGINPFMLIELNSFELAFSGMIQWEDTMTRDLEPVFHKIREITIEREIPNPEYIETETTEEGERETEEEVDNSDDESEEIPQTIIETTKENWRSAKYYDQILFNKDTRVLKKDSGETGIMYTFLDDRYLLISTEISTINKIMGKISEYYIANY